MENTKKSPTIIKPFGEAEIDKHAGTCGGKRNLKEIVITTEDDEQFVYLVKKPSKSVMQAIASAEKKNNIDAVQNLTIGCVLEGDKQAYEHDGSIYIELMKAIGKMVNTSKGEVKKL